MPPTRHSGVPGATTITLQNNITAHFTAGGRAIVPHIVVLHVGVNDINNLNAAGVTVAQRSADLWELIWDRAPAACLIICQIMPVNPAGVFAGNASKIIDYNAALVAHVASKAALGRDIMLVDCHTGFPAGGWIDPAHPDAVAARFMSSRILGGLVVAGTDV